jgi:uncharacterized protein GlcG (DUF336 family)
VIFLGLAELDSWSYQQQRHEDLGNHLLAWYHAQLHRKLSTIIYYSERSSIYRFVETQTPQPDLLAMTPVPFQPVKVIETISQDAAKAAISACEEKARSIRIPMNIAVTDAATHLLAFSRMDGAKITSINIAIDKAFTASGHRVGTHTYKEAVWPGGAAFGIWNTNDNRFTTIGGGLPVLGKEGQVLGAIGCSTGTPAQDQEVAQAGIDALQKLLKGTPRAKL